MIRHVAAIAGVLLAATAGGASAQLAKQITIQPGKGVSFYMGSQQGTAIFNSEGGACVLTVMIGPAAAETGGMSGMAGGMGGMSGMASGKGSTIKMQVLPARPAQFQTPDGQQLVFNCGPEAKQMFFDMPAGLKYSDK
jgi:hypothetical protein